MTAHDHHLEAERLLERAMSAPVEVADRLRLEANTHALLALSEPVLVAV